MCGCDYSVYFGFRLINFFRVNNIKMSGDMNLYNGPTWKQLSFFLDNNYIMHTMLLELGMGGGSEVGVVHLSLSRLLVATSIIIVHVHLLNASVHFNCILWDFSSIQRIIFPWVLASISYELEWNVDIFTSQRQVKI